MNKKALLISGEPSLMHMIKAVYDEGSTYPDQADFIALHGHVCGLAKPEKHDPKSSLQIQLKQCEPKMKTGESSDQSDFSE